MREGASAKFRSVPDWKGAMLKAFLRHVALPAVAPAAVVGLYFTPVLLFGCVNRGLLALAVVLLSAGAAFVTVGIGLREQARGRSSAKWLISTLILTTPLVLVLGPLG
jgi:hypothetical protein